MTNISSHNLRKHQRVQASLGEGIKVYLRNTPASKDVQIHSYLGEAIDFSPWGMGVIIPDNHDPHLPQEDQRIEIHCTTREKQSFRIYGVVRSRMSVTRFQVSYLRYGIEFAYPIQPPEKVFEKAGTLYKIPDFFRPHAWCENPFFFKDEVLFKVEEFHVQGLKLVTSSRNKFFLPQVELKLNIILAMQGAFSMEVRVKQALEQQDTPQAKKKYSVFVEFIRGHEPFLTQMMEYLLFGGLGVSPAQLRKEGFPVANIEKCLSFYYADEDRDFETIQKLRSQFSFHQSEREFLASQKNASHLICNAGMVPIACIQALFNLKDFSKSQFACLVEHIPPWILEKKIVEISHLAWDVNYRESDVFINMMRHIIRATIELGMTHIVCLSPPSLKHLYEKVGFHIFKFAWKYNVEESQKQESILFLDAKSILYGEKNVEASVWHKIYEPIAQFLGIRK